MMADRLHNDLNRLDSLFLKRLSLGLGLSLRTDDHRLLVKTLSQDLTAIEGRTAFLSYLLCKDPSEVSSILLRNRQEKLRSVSNLLGPGELLFEVSVGTRTCDLVLIGSDIIAIENKNPTDNVRPAKHQTQDYLSWADRVYLMIDSRKRESIISLAIDNRVGIIEVFDRELLVYKQAVSVVHDPGQLCALMTYEWILRLARLKEVSQRGTKNQIIQRLVTHLETRDFRNFFSQFLRHRAKARLNMAPKLSVATAQTYL